MSAIPASVARFRPKPSAPDQAARESSELFVARSIATQLQNSSYGHFHRYLQHCGLEGQLLQLPRVIVVGDRSAGKSSLLESITKCPIFPRHRDFCTKAPIRLRMKNDPKTSERQVTIYYPGRPIKRLQAAHEILAEVNAIMQGITEIDDKAIVIEICQAGMPTFEVVDLPGIQTYPAEQEKLITKLVSEYLSKPDTLVLCVIDATTSAFDNSIALKLITAAGKLKDTIVAMTKADLVPQEEEYVPKIFDRILGQSSDNEHPQDLAGCVAVANRPAAANLDSSLAEADLKERQIFARMLHDPADAFAFPDIQRQLRDNMTVQHLILQLDHMCHSYIMQHWKSAFLTRIDGLIASNRNQLVDLGPPVEQLTAVGVFKKVLEQVSHADTCSAVWRQLQDIRRSAWKPWDHHTLYSSPMERLIQDFWALHQADDTVSIRRHAQSLLKALCNETNLLTPLQEQFLLIFKQNLLPRPQRFPALQACIGDELAPALASSVMAEVKPKLERIVESTLADLYWPEVPLSAYAKFRVEHLDRALERCIISYFREAIHNECNVPKTMQLPEGFKLEEVQAQRAELHADISRLQTAHSQISHIEDAFSTPESPSAALAAAINSAFGPAPSKVALQQLANNAHSAVDQQIFQGSTIPHAAAPLAMSAPTPAAPTLEAAAPAPTTAASTVNAVEPTAVTAAPTANAAVTAATSAATLPIAVATAESAQTSVPAVAATPALTVRLAAPSALSHTAPPAATVIPKEENANVGGAQAGKQPAGLVFASGTPVAVTASAAQIEAELEDIPVSLVVSVADSFVHV